MRKLLTIIIFSALLGIVLSCSYNEELVYVPGEYMTEESERYGVRWSLTDVDDLGQRCFGAVGKYAKIGIGDQDGYSDFDSIYPWSEMKLCTIDGDVFVRIPKFSVERYTENGYEYRVITKDGPNPHPAFVEDGIELDEIYVSAYEGYAENDKLYSRADVIPSSNFTPEQFLTMAQNRGTNYTLYDMRTVDLIFTLFAVEYGCRNSGVILGHGIAMYLQALEKESAGTDVFYSKVKESGTNQFKTKYRGGKKKISEGSNICICKGMQDSVMTYARVLSISDSEKESETIYTFDGDPIDVDTDCFIGSCAQHTNWTETCSAPLSWHTGRANMKDGYTTDQRNPMRYRWIENIVGNLWAYLPDVTFVDDKMYVCDNMRDYVMHKHEYPYKALGYIFPYNDDNGKQVDSSGNNYWTTSLLWDTGEPAMSFGISYDTSISSDQAFGAYYYRRDGVNVIANGGGFDHEFRCNILTNRAWIFEGKKWYLYGARLIYKDIEGSD